MESTTTITFNSSLLYHMMEKEAITVPYSHRDVFILFLYLLTAVTAITGNVFVCATIYRKKKLTSTTYVLIFNMAISDILGGAVIPAQWLFCSTVLLETGIFFQSVCGLMKNLQVLSYYVSSLTMTAIAYDRYKLVCRPMTARLSVSVLLAIVWVLGLLFISQNFVLMRVSEYFSPTKGLITCRIVWQYASVGLIFRKVRILVLMVTQYFIPLGLVVFWYGAVVRQVWYRQQVGTGGQDADKRAKFDEKKAQTIKMLIFVTALFAASYLPTHIWHYLFFFTTVFRFQKNSCHSSTAYMISYWLGISSCAYNPFIYCYFNGEFQREALRYWRMVARFCGCTSVATSGEDGDERTSSGGGGHLGVTTSQTDSTSNDGHSGQVVHGNDQQAVDAFILFLYLLTAVTAILGNVFVCRLTSTTYVLIFNMAISDILGGLVIPGQWLFCSTALLDTGIFFQSACGLGKTFQILSYYVSSLTMTAIAYDRYMLVCRPIGGTGSGANRRIDVRILLAVVWALGLIFISQNFATLRVSEYFSPSKGLITCRVVWVYDGVPLILRRIRALSLMITQYVLPLALTSVFYALVVRQVWYRQQVGAPSSDQARRKAFDEKKRTTIVMLIFVTALFAASYLPTHIWHLLLFYTKLIPVKRNTCYSSTAYMISYWVGISSCAFNPFIYVYFNGEFRNEALRYWTMVTSACGCGGKLSGNENNSGEGSSGCLGTSSTDSTGVTKHPEKLSEEELSNEGGKKENDGQQQQQTTSI
ncbi:Neuropeptide Y receptor [Tyrophagus putrescentiae]|nr:Neuropeptide Y receptor [Tyrophagus putrescentiae]